MPSISPSILSVEPAKIAGVVKKLEGKSESVHIDVMDGKFVPNNTLDRMNPQLVRGISGVKIVKNVHLMVEDHLHWSEKFCEAGADEVAFHYETGKVDEGITLIKGHGVKVGIAIKPKTQPREIASFFPKLDFVLVMSVEPGFGGQAFMPESLSKISWLRENYSREYGGKIWVDGGVNDETGVECARAGADFLVAGNALFKHADFLAKLSEMQGKIGGRP